MSDILLYPTFHLLDISVYLHPFFRSLLFLH